MLRSLSIVLAFALLPCASVSQAIFFILQKKGSSFKMSETAKSNLTDAEKARIERNKLKAQHLRHAKLVAHPYARGEATSTDKIIKIQGSRYVDSGGGFLIEESALRDEKGKKIPENDPETEVVLADDGVAVPITFEECIECGDKFVDSYLMMNFDYSVCDKCRDPEEKHSLITKTEAKQEYLLKDCDLDKREPILKFITRKNPHNIRWGEMKLYLHLQIEKRALEVWGSEETLLKQREEREEKRELGKMKKYNKQLKQLRMDVRSSLYDKTTSASHTHTFGAEIYNEEDDTYTHSCQSCGYSETFEKM